MYTTVVENNYITNNPTTIIRQNSGGGGSSDGVSMELFRKQVDRIYDSMGNAADGVREDMEATFAGFAESFSTALLAVSGNASVGGDLSVGGTLTADSLSVSSLSSANAVEAPYYTATTSTASTFPYASTTAVSVSSLTSGRITYAGTGGMLQDSANLTFNGSLLTVAGNASTTQLTTTDSTYLATAGGNVGIGTAAPTNKLDVIGSSAAYGTANYALNVSGLTNFTRTETATNNSRPVAMMLDFVASPSSAIGASTDWHGIDLVGRATSNNLTANSSLYPFESTAVWGGTNTIGSLVAGYLQTRNTSSGTVNNATGLLLWHQNVGNGTTGQVRDIYIRNPNNTGSGVITNNYGIYIDAQTAGVANYGIYNLSERNVFNAIQVGADVSPDSGVKLSIFGTSGATSQIFRIGTVSNRYWDINAAAYNAASNNYGLTVTNPSTGHSYHWSFMNNGNVGIATTSPGYKFDVYGTTASQIHVTSGGVDNGAYISSVGENVAWLSGGAGFSGAWTAKSTNAGIVGTQSGRIEFYTNSALTPGSTFTPTERMRIASNGNVGIGGSPNARFEIKSSGTNNLGGLLLRASGSSEFPILMYEDAAGEGKIELYATGGVQSTMIQGAGNSFFTGGNIGIGTTSPSAKLAVTQSAQTAAGGFWLAASDNTDFRSMFMNTSGVLSFHGGDTAGTLNTATLNAAGEWTNASDIAYKENIETLAYGLDAVLALQPRSYDIKNTNDHRIGFIAQEVEDVIPEVVGGKEGSKGISYGNLVAVAVRAIQELSEKISGFADIFKTNRVETNTLCVGQTCITESELIELLDEAGQNSAPTPSTPEPEESTQETPTDEEEPPVNETTEEPGTPAEEEVAPEPEEESTPEPEPELESAPESPAE